MPRHRRVFDRLCLALLAVVVRAGWDETAAAGQPPNLPGTTADDLACGDVSCQERRLPAPSVDRPALGGRRVTRDPGSAVTGIPAKYSPPTGDHGTPRRADSSASDATKDKSRHGRRQVCKTVADRNAIRILFIGNSYTFANDLPAMLAKLSVAGRQRRIVHAVEAPGGCTFEQHVAEGRAAAAIAADRWDYVVLQEQSVMPVSDPARTLEFGGRLDRAARAAGAHTLFFQTWARAGEPAMQDGLTATYAELARRAVPAAEGGPGGTVVAAGEAWRLAGERHPAVPLHVADGSHPTPAGTYLAACVFYAVIHGESPVGLPGRCAGLGDAAARRLQETAWAVARPAATPP